MTDHCKDCLLCKLDMEHKHVEISDLLKHLTDCVKDNDELLTRLNDAPCVDADKIYTGANYDAAYEYELNKSTGEVQRKT